MNRNDAEFFKKLRYTFKIEAYEHLKTISLSLVKLEKAFAKEDQKSLVEAIHREFHSLKGAARAVNMKEIETICHMLENIFSKVKKEILICNVEMFDIFNRAIDTIEEILSLNEDKVRDISEIMSELKKIEHSDVVKNESIKSDHKDIECHDVRFNTEIKSNRNIKLESEQEKNSQIKALEAIKAKENIKTQIKGYEDSTSEILRISKAKLDALLLQGEEMIYAKLSAIQRANEIKEIKELFDLWKKENDVRNVSL
ncbi:Hpt domain-containing protein [Crassaminicella indica]|uniref:Hpt domain-containing protein n=1 Tax=Crassaminicella indica TaxID=2855394 RepID=A0ABX8RAW4_9CLOT|nr:Hpt domain-containing protein [Crassaminicella indica]QXM06192.1 Hpt domain-containing protein [Crassaminicella indica]